MAISRNEAFAPVTDSAGKTTNPTTASVLADTAGLAAGLYEVRVLVGCSVAATFNIQHRDAANTGIVTDTVVIRAAAGQTGEYLLKYDIKLNERLRVLPEANITGDAEVTINALRVV